MDDLERQIIRADIEQQKDSPEAVELLLISGAIHATTPEESGEILTNYIAEQLGELYAEAIVDPNAEVIDYATLCYNSWRASMATIRCQIEAISDEETPTIMPKITVEHDILLDILSRRTNLMPDQFKLQADVDLAQQVDDITRSIHEINPNFRFPDFKYFD